MKKPRYRQNTKTRELLRNGTINPKPDEVVDELFRSHDFFDPNDLMQVKYEMLRRVGVDGVSVTKATADFGFSRRHFYEIQRRFDKEGLSAFIAEKRGPRGAHKLTPEIMDFIEKCIKDDAALRSKDLATMIKNRFKVSVHTRSIERGLEKRKKNEKPRKKSKSLHRKYRGDR